MFQLAKLDALFVAVLSLSLVTDNVGAGDLAGEASNTQRDEVTVRSLTEQVSEALPVVNQLNDVPRM